MKTDEQLVNELEDIYHQVAEEHAGDSNSSFEQSPSLFEDDPSGKQISQSRRFKFKVFMLMLLVILAAGFILWPFIYNEGLTKSGDTVYPARTNRITGEKSYFYNDEWRKELIPEAIPVRAPITVPIENPVPVVNDDLGKLHQSIEEPQTEGRYTIQIKAIKNMEDVNEFLTLLRGKGLNPHWEAVKIKNKGTWYRIFIGRFQDTSEAKAYMKESKLAISFPGSFVQKISSDQP